MRVDVELRHLRALVVLAEELNFTRAAERLHMSQQALSTQIRQLELRIGTQLVERDTRRVAMTPAGTELCSQARSLLAGAEKAVSTARELGGDRPGLTIGFRVAPVHRLVGAALDLFAERHPDVELSVRFGDFMEPSAGLRDGDVDVAIVAGPFDESGLELVPLFSEPLGAILARNHPLARKPSLTLAEFLSEPLINLPSRDETFRNYWTAGKHRDGSPPRFAATANSLDGMYEAVRAELGVATGIESVVESQGTASGLVFRPVDGLEPLVFRVGRRIGDERPEVVGFIAAAREALAERSDQPKAG
jgi:DNA-binding transcriptional LysR family regulator